MTAEMPDLRFSTSGMWLNTTNDAIGLYSRPLFPWPNEATTSGKKAHSVRTSTTDFGFRLKLLLRPLTVSLVFRLQLVASDTDSGEIRREMSGSTHLLPPAII